MLMILAAGVVAPLNWSAVEVLAINGLIPPLVMVLVYYARVLMPRIPRVALPLLALALGPAVAWVGAMASGGSVDPVAAAALGGLATVLRELLSTVSEHGVGA